MIIPIAVIGGDGVGRELAELVSDSLQSCFDISLIRINAGYENYQKTGKNLSQNDLEKIAMCKGILFGATSSPKSRIPGYVSPILQLRKQFDLFVNIRPFKARLNRQDDFDLVILRENIEGFYTGRESVKDDGKVVAEKIVTEKNSERLARFAFEYAQKHNRKNVTVVHKSNIFELSDGLFREICFKVGKDYPGIDIREELVDTAAYYLIRDPQRFDTILTMNMYGDILSNVAAGVADGLGFAPSLSVGPSMVLAEPIHGSAPDIAGKDIANPYGMIFSLCLMLKYLRIEPNANLLYGYAEEAISEGFLTPDAGGKHSSKEVVSAIEKKLLNRLQ